MAVRMMPDLVLNLPHHILSVVGIYLIDQPLSNKVCKFLFVSISVIKGILMKHTRRRRHLRPRPTRSQVNHQIEHVRSNMQLFQLEWLMEAQRPSPSQPRLRFLHDTIVAMRDEIASLENL
jgi:hypothetical protein